MGIKERRTKILVSMFLLSDVNFEYLKLDDRTLSFLDLNLNQKTKSTLATMVGEGLLEEREVEGRMEYRISQRTGFIALCLSFPYFRFLKDSWDQKWRILSYEIPEKKRELRDKLRREVAGWGLGPWHRSFWLTPHPIIEQLKNLITGKEEERYIQAFEADHVFGDREVLIEKVWARSQLDKKYRELFKKWHDILSKDEDKAAKFKKVSSEFITILKTDPGLPKDLLGDSWIGLEAFNIFREIRGILLS